MRNLSDNLLHPVFSCVSDISAKLGIDTYVVGGYVRDMFLHRETKDIDLVTIGSGIELAQAIAKELEIEENHIAIFKNYGTAMFRYQGINVEFVGTRKESYTHTSRNPIVEKGNLQDDQNRRDFTINAMAISLNKHDYGTLIDPFNGLDDLQNKIIRTPLDPEITFLDDPLRILRAVRFASQLNFTIEPSTLAGMYTQVHRIGIVSKERIIEELHKILLSRKPSIGLVLLDAIGALELILPSLVALKGVDTVNGHAHKDNFLHTIEVVDNIALNTSNLWLIWAALLHDIGKSETKKYIQGQGWTFYQHELVGARMVSRIFKTLRMPLNDKMEYVKKLVFLHLRPIALVEDIVTDSAIRRLLFDAGDDIDDLMLLCEADITSKNQMKIRQYLTNFELVRRKLKDIEEKDRIRNFQPPISGELIMEVFNLKPCRDVGIIKNAIREAILDGEIENQYDACYQIMLREATKLGLKPKQ
ncbi:MAG: CCA tRNA nucleotidyltransferase [Bacteroidales bacterium]|jgi:poly(A) polymerase|nr:CCA tRNA nucleotidyltransferase [Bacteroidales bacterium]